MAHISPAYRIDVDSHYLLFLHSVDRDTGGVLGFAFVTLSTPQEALDAAEGVNVQEIDDRANKVIFLILLQRALMVVDAREVEVGGSGGHFNNSSCSRGRGFEGRARGSFKKRAREE